MLNAKEKTLRSEGEEPLPKVTGTPLKKMDRFGAEEMAPQLRALVVLSEDLDLVSSICMAVHNCL